jgi:hypothetical protein
VHRRPEDESCWVHIEAQLTLLLRVRIDAMLAN